MINITPKQTHNFHIKQLHKINMTKQKAKEQKITNSKGQAATKVKHIVHSNNREKAKANMLGQNAA